MGNQAQKQNIRSRKRLRIFDENQNYQPRTLFSKHKTDESDEDSIIVEQFINIVRYQPLQEPINRNIYEPVVPKAITEHDIEQQKLYESIMNNRKPLTTRNLITQQQLIEPFSLRDLIDKNANVQTHAGSYIEITLEDGRLYHGEWANGAKNGYGRLTESKDKFFEGYFENDMKHGQGVEIFDIKSSTKEISICQAADRQHWKQYTGSFKNNQMDGEGILELANGSCVIGNFQEWIITWHSDIRMCDNEECFLREVDSWRLSIFMIRLYSKYHFASQCYYKLLNISTDSTTEQIKQAYFELAKKYHPDTNPDTTVDPEQFRKLQEAYKVLSNEDKRKKYDQDNGIISQQFQGNPTFGDNQDVYNSYASMHQQHIKQNEKEYTEYFENQYFTNKEFFKRKVDEDGKWNFSETLFHKHQKIVEKNEEYFLHQPFSGTAYWEKKTEMEPQPFNINEFLWSIRYFISAGFLIGISYFSLNYLNQQNQGKQTIIEGTTNTSGSGYRVKILPINIA